MDAVEEALVHIARERDKGQDVRMVSFRQFTDWLDVQSPDVLAALRTLQVGESPAGEWNAFLKNKVGAIRKHTAGA